MRWDDDDACIYIIAIADETWRHESSKQGVSMRVCLIRSISPINSIQSITPALHRSMHTLLPPLPHQIVRVVCLLDGPSVASDHRARRPKKKARRLAQKHTYLSWQAPRALLSSSVHPPT